MTYNVFSGTLNLTQSIMQKMRISLVSSVPGLVPFIFAVRNVDMAIWHHEHKLKVK